MRTVPAPGLPGHYRMRLRNGDVVLVKVADMNGQLWVVLGVTAIPIGAFDGLWVDDADPEPASRAAS